MNINEFIEKYSSDNFNSFIKENATIDYWNDLIKTYKLEKLKFVFPDTMQLSLNPILKEGSDMFWGKEFDGFCERQIEILKIKNQYKPQKTKYNLFTFFENLKNDWEYIKLNESLNSNNGFIVNLNIKSNDGTTANVYSAGMWYILTKDEYKNEGFIDAYCKGYENGKDFIKNKINNALNGFYRSNSKEYINELQYAYFFDAENYILGYKNGAYNVPINFYIDSIENIGFSAGVVTAIDLMAKENPILFAGFYDIDTEQPQKQKTNNPDEIKTDEIKIIDKLKQNEFDDVEPSKVYQHFKQLVDNKYITNENFNLFLRTVFEQNKTLTTKIEIIKPNSKQRVQKIFYSYFEKFVQNKYGTKQTYIDLLCNNFTGFNSKTLSTNFAK